jgi:hypothetical protein
LIRYASGRNREKKPFKFTARMKGYTTYFGHFSRILMVYYFYVMTLKQNIRLPGQLFQHKGENIVYTYKIINKTNNDFNDVHFKLAGIKDH